MSVDAIIDEMWDEWSNPSSSTPDELYDSDAECAGLLSGLLKDNDESKTLRQQVQTHHSLVVLRPRHLRVTRRLLRLWRKTAWFASWNIADRITLPLSSSPSVDTGLTSSGSNRVTIRLPKNFRDELIYIAKSLADTADSSVIVPVSATSIAFDHSDSIVSPTEQEDDTHTFPPAFRTIFSWLRGLWGSCGSLYLPRSGYYLVLRVSSNSIAEPLHTVLARTGLPWHERTHFSAREFTLRDLESIVTFLCNIGLSDTALSLEDRSIVRSMRDQANRVRNCDTANIHRAVPVAKEQVKLAMSIVKAGLLPQLPEPLQELVEVRLANPEASLGELGEKLSSPITKSAVRYKWQRLRDHVSSLQGSGTHS